MKLNRIVLVTLMASVCLVVPPCLAEAAKGPENPIDDLVERLLSDDPEIARVARSEFEQMGNEPFTHLIQRIEEANEGGLRKYEIYRLGLLLSPWLRGKERSARFIKYTQIQSPGFPVERPAGHPLAPEIREFLKAFIEDTISQLMALEGKTGGLWSESAYHLQEEFGTACGVLAEVADGDTIDWAFDLLGKIESPHLGTPLIALVDRWIGLRPAFRPSGICGNSSPEEFEAFRKEENERYANARQSLGETWQRLRPMPPEDRGRFLIGHWRSYFVPKQESYSGSFFHGGDRTYQELEPLIRKGNALVPLLRAQQKEEKTLEARAVWEVAIATITANENPELVRELIAQGRDTYWKYACEIIAGARSTKWLRELEELQQKPYFDTDIASEVAAGCHREDSIPSLRKALQFQPQNSAAKYAILEFEARAKQGGIKGLRGSGRGF